jgi:hypothetical protein
VGGPYTIPNLITRGMVRYRPTATIIELCRFTRSIYQHAVNTVRYLLTIGPKWYNPQSTQMGATTLVPRIYTCHTLTYPSDDTRLSLTCPSVLKLNQLCQTSNYTFPPSNYFLKALGGKSSNLVSGTYHSTSTNVLSSKHCSANALSPQKRITRIAGKDTLLHLEIQATPNT